MDKTPHYIGHRERLRERFRRNGFDGLQDYEVLELMLTYALPRKDVKPLAKELMARFGGFKGVLDAPFEELGEVKGLGENAATFLIALKGTTARYLREKLQGQRTVVSSPDALLAYCRAAMGGLKDEQFRAVFLNSRNEVIDDEVLHEGTVNQSVVYPRKVMERALKHNATALIFVHNHPSGACRPSSDDRAITAELVRIARGLGIAVHDHLIICRDGHFSFLEQGLL
jgi:DNA repair protein RadC